MVLSQTNGDHPNVVKRGRRAVRQYLAGKDGLGRWERIPDGHDITRPRR